jgi:hypothetical protein
MVATNNHLLKKVILEKPLISLQLSHKNFYKAKKK